MRRLAFLLVTACVLAAPAPSARADGKPSPFPNGLSPQWLNAADVEPTACLERLKASGARYTVLPPQARPDRKGCGVPHGVFLTRGPTGIVYAPPLLVDCSFAAELPAMETAIQEEARAELGTEIRRIDTLGAYACVTRAGPYTTRYSTKPAISEHSFGLAVDLRSFTPAKGREITVQRDYEKGTDAPREARGRFLREVARRLRHETGLTHVLTPDFDAAHFNHFHVDRGLPFGWWWAS
ncbi:MAG TPA: extensin family protein [Polyangiaceae bacterium]|jgi:hypothetical protein